MTEARLRELRRIVRTGKLPADLVEELRSVALRLARLRLLPPSFAPYGQWDDEAAAEVFAAWYTDRLLGQGHLQALLDRARTPGAFRRLAERSLRQHLMASKDRSQVHNLYKRLIAVLDEGVRFVRIQDAMRPQDRWYSPNAAAEPWLGPERLLVANAWALGDFNVIRYRAGAAKLSPVLEVSELERFTVGLMEGVGGALTPTLVMRALTLRFDLGEVVLESLAESGPSAPGTGADDAEFLLRDVAHQVLAQLSPRQAAVLLATVAEEPVAAMAERLGCAAGTIINEQRRIGSVVERFSADEDDRGRLLNIVADLLYSQVDE